MTKTSGVARSFQGGGGAARERKGRAGGGCWRGFPPSLGREIFDNSCIKLAFWHIKFHFGV